MIVRCVCLGLLIITLSGCNRAMDNVRVDNTPSSAYQDQHILFPLLQLQLDQEIRARLNAQIAQNLSKGTAITVSDYPINTALKADQNSLRRFDLAGQMQLHCSGLCENAHLKGSTTISLNLDNRHFTLNHIALRDDEYGVTLTGSINQYLYGADHALALADANVILRTPNGDIEIVNKATLLMVETPYVSSDSASGQIEISHHDSNTHLWGNYISVSP